MFVNTPVRDRSEDFQRYLPRLRDRLRTAAVAGATVCCNPTVEDLFRVESRGQPAVITPGVLCWRLSADQAWHSTGGTVMPVCGMALIRPDRPPVGERGLGSNWLSCAGSVRGSFVCGAAGRAVPLARASGLGPAVL